MSLHSGSVCGKISEAWDQVEVAQVDLLGVSAKLTCLDSEDKQWLAWYDQFPVCTVARGARLQYRGIYRCVSMGWQ